LDQIQDRFIFFSTSIYQWEEIMTDTSGVSKYFKTSDGVKLHYIEAGSGPPLVMIPGWSQTAEQFKYQIKGLSDRYHCIAVDMRGHGESEKVDFGYKIQRLAKDLHEFLTRLRLSDVALLGHSLGCSVIWCYWDLFGSERISKLILVDESPFLTSNPLWKKKELEASGAILDANGVIDTYNAIAGPQGETTTINFIDSWVTSSISEDKKAWIIKCNMKLPRQHAATLLYNNCAQDWRDLIPRINIPTLVIGGKASVTPWKSQIWIHEQIPDSKIVLFEEEEGGKHLMFIEGAEKFNEVVSEFLDKLK
jgi:non-heme chloroperoxidase